MRAGLGLAIAAGMALACSGTLPDMTPKAPPAALSKVVGSWAAATATDRYTLNVGPDGSLHYERQGSVSSQLDLPITAWRDAEFDAGVGFVGTTFHITSAPHQEAGVWKMTVDGVDYQRMEDVPMEALDDGPAVLAP